MSKSQNYIQCPCGRVLKDPSEYKLLYLKKEQNEVDILCPNDTCYLRELGFVKFKVTEEGKIKIEKASFYPPFVTWNVARLGKAIATKILRTHLKWIYTKGINWEKIKVDIEKRKKEK